MPKPFIPRQNGTSVDSFSIGKIKLDAGGVSSPWSFTFPGGPGTAGYVLSTNGSGVLSWIAVGAASDSTTPYFIPDGEIFVNNENRQNLYSSPITIDGTLEVNGLLVEV